MLLKLALLLSKKLFSKATSSANWHSLIFTSLGFFVSLLIRSTPTPPNPSHPRCQTFLHPTSVEVEQRGSKCASLSQTLFTLINSPSLSHIHPLVSQDSSVLSAKHYMRQNDMLFLGPQRWRTASLGVLIYHGRTTVLFKTHTDFPDDLYTLSNSWSLI